MVFYCCCRCRNQRDDLGVGKVPADCCRSCIDICPLRRGEKKLNLDAFYSITLETFFVLPFALAYVLSLGNGGMGHFNVDDLRTAVFLIGAGAVTATPLVLFSIGANDLPLNVLGFCQYISPSITLLLGIFLFGEPFTRAQLSAFSFIWSALAVFTIADWRERKFLENGE